MQRRQFLRRSALFTLAATSLPGLASAFTRDDVSIYWKDKAVLKNGMTLMVKVYVGHPPEIKENLDSKSSSFTFFALKVEQSDAGTVRLGSYSLERISSTQKGNTSSATFKATSQGTVDLLQGVLPKRIGMKLIAEESLMIELEEGTFTELTPYNCFLTTACTDARGLPDDCPELTLIRGLRDGHMRGSAQGSALVADYYRIAPRIVNQVNARPNRAAIWDLVYTDLVLPSVALIQAGKKAEAVRHYADYVRWMQEAFTPEPA